MCGIAGLWMPDLPDAGAQVAGMIRRLHHRGPDDDGLWSAPAGGACLGQARLAIVDLSQEGHQPMHSASGRYTITFNGEIYNHMALRRELGEQPWRGHADTESFLAAIERWGVDAALERAVGMFAFALWDREARVLTLARDRLGEKPLYYAATPRGVAFASELKALKRLPGVDLGVDEQAVGLYLQLGCVPAPLSIHRGVRKLLPAHTLTWRAPDAAPVARRYWHGPDQETAIDTSSDAEALARFEALLEDSVRGQLMADVPLGTFLSGGVDSSLVTAIMTRVGDQRVRSFSIGFDAAEFDESAQARAVATHLGTDHTELHVSARDALDVVPTLADVYDEPFADSSQIPTLLLAKLTRRHVTVALSGDGGDELFGGYNRHVAAARLWPRLERVPGALRRPVAGTLAAVPANWWDGAGAWMRRRDAAAAPSALGEKLHKLSGLVGARDAAEAYRAALLQWRAPAELLGRPVDVAPLPAPTAATLPEQMMRWDMQGYLPDDILVKVDRAAMRHSLETRVPLLDHRVVGFALAQPLERKIRNGRSKWLMRELLYRHVPRELIERPKQGFALPLDAWLRGPLREWAEGLLEPSALRAAGWLEAAPVERAWREHLSGRRNHQQRLWNLLMLQSWAREQAR
jgi:asparagine synthase (glutamine-hydrolysing)